MSDFKTIEEIGFRENDYKDTIIQADFKHFRKDVHSRVEIWSWLEEEYSIKIGDLIAKRN